MTQFDFDHAEEIVQAMRRLTIHQRSRKTELLRRHGLQAGQDAVLLELSILGKASQNELAHNIEVDEPSAGRSIRRLEARGLIARAVDPDDARRRVIELTPEGRKLIPKIKRAHIQLAEEALGDASPGRRRRLINFLNETADRFV